MRGPLKPDFPTTIPMVMNSRRLPFARLPFKDRCIWVCVALQMLLTLGLLGFVLSSRSAGLAAPAAPPGPDESPSSIRSIEDPMSISPNHRRPARSSWM